MKALTLHQPWASLVARGVKTIETRSWRTNFRGPLAIHAGLRRPIPGPSAVVTGWGIGWYRIRYPDRLSEGYTLTKLDGGRILSDGVTVHETWPLPLGAVVATCTLVDVVPISPSRGDMDRDTKRLLWTGHVEGVLSLEDYRLGRCKNVEDQRPYGIYEPGRYAWLLADIKPLAEPIPARGRQGLWNWQEVA